VLRGLRFFELFRRSRRYEERLSALQSSFDQSGGTPPGSPRQQRPDDARAELLIGLNDDLDEMRRGSRSRRSAAIFAVPMGIFMLLNAPDLFQGAVFAGILLALGLGSGWLELRRHKRVRLLQRLIERESLTPLGKESPPASQQVP